MPAIRSAAIPRLDPGFRRDDERGDVGNPDNFKGFRGIIMFSNRTGSDCQTGPSPILHS